MVENGFKGMCCALPWLDGPLCSWQHPMFFKPWLIELTHSMSTSRFSTWLGPPHVHVQVKFFYVEAKFSLTELDCMCQCPREDLDKYIKRFHDKVPDCCDPVKGVLVEVCLRCMLEENNIFLENLSISSFFKLMEAIHWTNESVSMASQPNLTS